LALLATLFFFCTGLVCLPHLGIENDELYFGMADFAPFSSEYTLRIGHSRFPLMLMSYLGTFKAWLYRPIFRLFGTGMWAIRVPALLIGAGSVWLFYLLVRRVAGERAALIGCSLLAVDSSYSLTVCFDWGPVALQHLLTIGGLLLLVKFYQDRSHWALAGGFFLWGLALWDKALAAWILSGIGAASALVFPRPILALVTRKRLATAVLAFVLGALPLLIYNARRSWPTFAGNFHRDTSEMGSKARALMQTAKGEGLFGWMFYDDWQTPTPHLPEGILERASARISTFAGHPRQHLLFYAFLLAVLLSPLAGASLRPVLFALVALGVAWVQMAITAGAGGSVHHTILLWPLPHIVVAISFAAASRRLGRAGLPATAVVVAVMAISGALVANESYYLMWRNGGSQMWTDAIFQLSNYMRDVPKQNVYCMDWGLLDPLRVLNAGKLILVEGSDPISKPQLNAEDRDRVTRMLTDPKGLFLAHTKDYQFFPYNQKFLDFASQAGYERQVLAVIPDGWGRKVYEVYRFEGH
jgi:4-amino-4-deoxy-L-arabinose transferase-like glycosyltransferase